MSNQWDTTFACESHHVALRNQTNSIIANLYLTGLSREISESRPKDEVESFKDNKIKRIYHEFLYMVALCLLL